MTRRILAFLGLTVMVACARPLAPDVEPRLAATQPFIRGLVIAKDPQMGVLVEARPPGAYEVASLWVRPHTETSVQRKGAAGARWETLATGQTVSVWVRGPIMESLPPQAYATTVLIE